MVRIYGHPFASFYWKTLIALYERKVPFEFLMVDAEHPANAEAIGRLAPTGQGYPIAESHEALRNYRARLLARPSIARVVDEARPWRPNFPLKEHTPD